MRAALRLAASFGVAKLLMQIALTLWTQHLGYGYFRDEFYYIACARHLAWGFVDHGPIVAVQARLSMGLFGGSLLGVRMLSAVAEAIAVGLTGMAAWALGGRRPAQSLAMTGMTVAPITIAMGGYLSMNSFEPMFWTGCVIALVLLLRGSAPRACWVAFGVSAGLGLLNKPSMAFFLAALGVGLLLTPERRILFTRYAALGITLLILISLPNVLWQIHNHWPTLEFLHNGRVRHKNTSLPPLQFLLAQMMLMLPINVLLWMTGVVALLRNRSMRGMRWLGYTYLFFLVLMGALHAKDYYLAAVYPALFAAGAIAWERRFARSRSVEHAGWFGFPVFQALVLLSGFVALPMTSPVMRPAAWVAYTRALHLTRAEDETRATSVLPQFYADRFGWQEMSDVVVRTYQSLSPTDQAQVCIYGDNYGEAGAIDFLGRRAEPRLPQAISAQNSYWTWGLHGCSGELLISVTDDTPEEVAKVYREVKIVGVMNNPLAMPEEHKNIYLLRGRRSGRPIDWAKEKFYI